MDSTYDQPESELSRRTLLRAGMLTGISAAGLTTAATALVPAPATAATPQTVTVQASMASGILVTFTAQTNWRYCGRCQNIYWGGSLGWCAYPWFNSGTPYHVPGSATVYNIPIQVFGPVNSNLSFVQGGWRYCDQCACLVYGPNTTKGEGLCADAGQLHDVSASSDYYLPNGIWSGDSPLQGGWSWCRLCQCNYWGLQESKSYCVNEWVAANPPPHPSGSTVYYLFHN